MQTFNIGDFDETNLLGAKSLGAMIGSENPNPNDIEEGGSRTFDVYRQTSTGSGSYSVSSGGGVGVADADDFARLSGTVSFTGGSLSGTFTVITNEDFEVEPDETFTVTLNGGLSFQSGSFGSSSVSMTNGRILNDDSGTVTVFHNTAGGSDTFPTLEEALRFDTTADGDDVEISASYDLSGNSGTNAQGTVLDDDLFISASLDVNFNGSSLTPIVLTMSEIGDEPDGGGEMVASFANVVNVRPVTLTLEGDAYFHVIGNAADNVIDSNGYSSIEGGEGDDVLQAGVGFEIRNLGGVTLVHGDTLSGGRGEDVLIGADETVNTLDGFFGEQEISATLTSASVTGFAESDLILGGDRDDRILANGGQAAPRLAFDSPVGGAVGDTVFAGAGSDSIFVYGQSLPAVIDGDTSYSLPPQNGNGSPTVTVMNGTELPDNPFIDTLYIFSVPKTVEAEKEIVSPEAGTIQYVEHIVVTGGSEYDFSQIDDSSYSPDGEGIVVGELIRVLGSGDLTDLPIDSATKLALAFTNLLSTTIVGSQGDDTVIGGQGNDAIEGYFGLDTLTGGGGNDDTFYGLDDFLFARRGIQAADVSFAVPNTIDGDTITDAVDGEQVIIDTFRPSTSFTATLSFQNLTIDLDGDGDTDISVTIANNADNHLGIIVTPPTFTGGSENSIMAEGSAQGIIEFTTRPTGGGDPGGGGGGSGGNPSAGAFTFTEFDDVYTGSEESERLVALAGNDSVEGALGNDNIAGKTGDDTLRGGQGNDTLFGGQGNDRVFGDVGDDTIFGNLGNDIVSGNQGADTVSGGQGADTVFGGQGNDRMFGGQGDDLVFGNLGDDLVSGNMGNDLVNGGQGNDTLYGGQGNDTIVGGLGNDLMFGNLGADRFVFGTGSGTDRVGGFSQASGDRLDLQGQAFTTSTGPDGSAVLTLSGGGVVTLTGVAPGSVNAGFFA